MLWALLLGVFNPLKAQFISDEPTMEQVRVRRTVIKIDPSLFVFGQIPGTADYHFKYEFAVGIKHSLQISLAYISKNIPTLIAEANDTSNTTKIGVNGFRGQLSYKFYPFGMKLQAPAGFFVGAHVSINRTNFTYKQSSTKYRDYTVSYDNAALIWGYQFILNNRFSIEFFQGLGYRDNRIRNDYTGEEEKLNFNGDVTPFPGSFKIYFGAALGLNY